MTEAEPAADGKPAATERKDIDEILDNDFFADCGNGSGADETD